MALSVKESFLGKWPWLGASIVLAFTAPWWFAMVFALGCVFFLGSFWPAVLTGFIIDTLYGPFDVLFFSKYRFALVAAVATIFLLALRRRVIFS